MIDLYAFEDELEKISAGIRDKATKDRIRRGGQAALVGAIGLGLGAATGHLIANAMKKKYPTLSPAVETALRLGAPAAGFAGGVLGRGLLSSKSIDYARGVGK